MRLAEDMRAEAARLTDRATGYAMCGERQLAGDMRRAASGLLVAVNMLELAVAAEGEAIERSREA